jgi:hypothetical protein
MNNILKLNPNGSVTLCARKTCCPVMEEINATQVRITDDNGNSIIINKDQAALINDGLKVLNSKEQQLLCE